MPRSSDPARGVTPAQCGRQGVDSLPQEPVRCKDGLRSFVGAMAPVAILETRQMQITTLDSQPAFIQVGQRVPTAGNAQGKSGSLQNVGLVLGLTPRINPDGAVTMEIDFERSELAANDNPASPPTTNVMNLQTTITCNDGETHVLGDVVAGLRYVFQRRRLRTLVLLYLSVIMLAIIRSCNDRLLSGLVGSMSENSSCIS